MQNMNEETIQAARAAWRRNPEDAAMALLGITPEEMFVQAIRGCNQHKHKEGCPDASGGGYSSADREKDLNLAADLRGLLGEMTGGRHLSELSRETRGEVEHVMKQLKEVESRIKSNGKQGADPVKKSEVEQKKARPGRGLDSQQVDNLKGLAASAKKNGDQLSVYYSANEGEDVYPESKAQTVRVRFESPTDRRGMPLKNEKQSVARLVSFMKEAGIDLDENDIEEFDYEANKVSGSGRVKLSKFPSSGVYEYSFPIRRKK